MKLQGNKKLQSLLLETGTQRIIELFCFYPELEFSLSDVARAANVAKPHASRILRRLDQSGVVEITKLANIWRIRANRQSWTFIKTKIIYNLNYAYQSGIVELLSERFHNPKAIIVFGSYRRGEDLSTSDIDIAIEVSEEQEYAVYGLRELADFERQTHRRVQIHVFHRANIDLNLFNNIANGIVLAGFLEVNL